MIREILAIVLAYLLGSISFAYVITRLAKGADIRRLGDGNPGAANVAREVGVAPGVAVLLLDAGKGALAISAARWLDAGDMVVLICGLAPVAGHMWPPFLGFRGGGGAATTLGVLLALAPREFPVNLLIIAVVMLLTGNPGFSVGVGLVPLPLVLWAFEADISLILFSILLLILLAIKGAPGFAGAIRRLPSQGWKSVIVDRRLRLHKKDKAQKN